MFYVFLFCAVIGGTVLICQFVLTLIGLGGEGHDFDAHADVDAPADLDVHSDVGDLHDGDHPVFAHDATNWLFGVISFRTVVAAITFFGLCGLAAQQVLTGNEDGTFHFVHFAGQLIVGLLGGSAAMFGVYGMIRIFGKLSHDGTVRIRRAIGKTATVYVPIDGETDSTGKVSLKIQGRLEEFPAVSDFAEKIATGAKVRVVGVVGQSTLKVEPAAKKMEAV